VEKRIGGLKSTLPSLKEMIKEIRGGGKKISDCGFAIDGDFHPFEYAQGKLSGLAMTGLGAKR
jgi:hypothetical protein